MLPFPFVGAINNRPLAGILIKVLHPNLPPWGRGTAAKRWWKRNTAVRICRSVSYIASAYRSSSVSLRSPPSPKGKVSPLRGIPKRAEFATTRGRRRQRQAVTSYIKSSGKYIPTPTPELSIVPQAHLTSSLFTITYYLKQHRYVSASQISTPV